MWLNKNGKGFASATYDGAISRYYLHLNWMSWYFHSERCDTISWIVCVLLNPRERAKYIWLLNVEWWFFNYSPCGINNIVTNTHTQSLCIEPTEQQTKWSVCLGRSHLFQMSQITSFLHSHLVKCNRSWCTEPFNYRIFIIRAETGSFDCAIHMIVAYTTMRLILITWNGF